MEHSVRTNTIATGLAMFSMFFGAGNVVFPLALGQVAQNYNFYAILGLLITAVGVPFLGLIAMTLYNGDYKQFFDRIGRIPGFLVAVAILGLIGPFGAIPRCITLSYATTKIYFPHLSLIGFSLVSCVVIFLLTFRKNQLLTVLGYILTPVLLGSLATIIIVGVTRSPPAPSAEHSPGAIFLTGLTEGYQTMDLFGAFFFSSVVLTCLAGIINISDPRNYKQMVGLTLKASAVGAALLALTYVGFSYTTAFNSALLVGVPKEELAGRVAILVLGPYASIVACVAVALACLTTAIALAAVFAEFIHNDISMGKINYDLSLLMTLIISFFVSTLNFMRIVHFLTPILWVCYPALIVLSILNILYKLYGFKPVKGPVFTVFAVSLLGYFFL